MTNTDSQLTDGSEKKRTAMLNKRKGILTFLKRRRDVEVIIITSWLIPNENCYAVMGVTMRLSFVYSKLNIIFWNPAIRKTNILSVEAIKNGNSETTCIIGFAYEPMLQDWRILMLTRDEKGWFGEIYSLIDKSWTSLDATFPKEMCLSLLRTSINNAELRLAYLDVEDEPHTETEKFVLSFDICGCKVHTVKMKSEMFLGSTNFALCKYHDLLSFMSTDGSNGSISLWSFAKTGVWEKLFNVRYIDTVAKPLWIWDSGEILFSTSYRGLVLRVPGIWGSTTIVRGSLSLINVAEHCMSLTPVVPGRLATVSFTEHISLATVKLKRVEFSKEEQDFYSILEAESGDQFMEYAAAGTIKQNYGNILLMLLHLRQACDHPLLVKGCYSKSIWKSSVETANELSQDKRAELLTSLEASFICFICNEPPEDAAVSICGHVFCSECICEHLMVEDNLCPRCKINLSDTLIFSKSTLSCSLDAQSPQDKNLLGSSGAPVQKIGSSDNLCFGSSKIKAALRVLLSLSKPRNDTVSSSSEVALTKDMESCSITSEGEKAIVFSQWTSMLDLLEACLKTSSIQYRRLDGTMSVLAREKAVKDFNTLPEVTVMIISLKTAFTVAASHVILLDLLWKPAIVDEAIDRVRRIFPTRPVTVLRLTVKDTIEDRILALQQKKNEIVASAFGEDETESRQTRLTVEDLNYLFMV